MRPLDYARLAGLELPPWAIPFLSYDNRYTYWVAYGGRSGAKSWSIARVIATLATFTHQRVVIFRHTETSIKDSAFSLLKDTLMSSHVAQYWHLGALRMYCERTGSEVFSRGVSAPTMHSIKGLERVTIGWIEEGQAIEQKPFEMLTETLVRVPGVRIFVTWNPDQRHNPVYQQFVANQHARAYVVKVNYTDNPFLSADALANIDEFKRLYPTRFAHTYLGEVDDTGLGLALIPYAWLEAAVKLYARRAEISDTRVHLGCDVADGGADANAIVKRVGPAIDEVMTWYGHAPEAGERLHAEAKSRDVWLVSYDRTAVGAGVAAVMERYKQGRRYRLFGVRNGSSPASPDRYIAQGIKNSDHFLNQGSQMGFNLARRAMNSYALLKGVRTPKLEETLMINPDIPDLQLLLNELAQPVRIETATSKFRVDKCPDKDQDSPNRYDAAALSFYWDLKAGYRVNRQDLY